ncbi:type I-E CRISPR-associated protein Cas6/Cse3/CasE [Streptantibioticus parmotrematis]|uniref:type I-E CRISPR-associated protein Cas6/Cse3/CasE n=1 Tax=Streptantibioticus parmotrematis TaxID=2873249 RepID=UPI0033FCB182
MYLTRFRVNAARAEARRLLASPHFLHGAVNMSFPDSPTRDGTAPRVLWRLDQAGPGRANLFIVSPTRPDLTHLVEQAGWPSLEEPGWTTFAYAEFLDRLHKGDTWNFRLTANPVHNIRRRQDPRDTPTKRAAHLTPRHQTEWLLQRQEKAGFEVVRKPAEKQLTERGDEYELIVHGYAPLRFHKRESGASGQSARRDVRFAQVTFDGRLRITDVEAFRRALTHGLGKAKAYGCGLMTLAPAG